MCVRVAVCRRWRVPETLELVSVRAGIGQLSGCAADFRSDMDVISLSLFSGENGIPSDVCEVFEGN